jgi:ribonuclease HI
MSQPEPSRRRRPTNRFRICDVRRQLEGEFPEGPITIATDASLRTETPFVACGFLTTAGSYGLIAHPHPRAIIGNAITTVAELRAVLYGIRNLGDTPATVLCDSLQAIRFLQRWQLGQVAYPRGYRTVRAHGRPSSLQVLAERIGRQPEQYTFRWVRSHNGHPLNEAADRLAKLAFRVANHGINKEAAIRQAKISVTKALGDYRPED